MKIRAAILTIVTLGALAGCRCLTLEQFATKYVLGPGDPFPLPADPGAAAVDDLFRE